MNNKNVNLHLQTLIKKNVRIWAVDDVPETSYFNRRQRREGKEKRNVCGEDAHCRQEGRAVHTGVKIKVYLNSFKVSCWKREL